MPRNARKSQSRNCGNKRKNAPLGKVRIEIQDGSSGMSPYGGLWPAVELFRKTGLPETIDSSIGARRGRGYCDSDHVLSLVLLNLAGGCAVDHLKDLRERLCFDSLGVPVPSPTSTRNWLKEFHNGAEDDKRGQGRAFVPEENPFLSGFRRVFSRLLSFSVAEAARTARTAGTAETAETTRIAGTTAKSSPPRGAGGRAGEDRKRDCRITLDQDATFIETEGSGSLWNYEKNRSYQTFNTYCPEHDLVLASGYRDGNVPPGYGQKEELERVLSVLPDEVNGVSLRSDCAGYQTDLLTYCNEGRNERFGRIFFGISCPMVREFREAIRQIPEDDWKPLDSETMVLKDGTVRPAAEWAEVHYFPNSLSLKKRGPDYRFFAIRDPRDPMNPKGLGDLGEAAPHGGAKERARQRRMVEEATQLCLLKEIEDDLDAARPEEKRDERFMTLGGRIYRTRGIVSNIEDGEDGSLFGCFDGEAMDGERIIHWQRKRCGKSEEIHHILKDELGGGHVPSGSFGANAAWWNISALALNIHNLLKRLLLPAVYGRSRPRTLRFLLYTMVCKIVRHGGRTILKIWSGDRGGALFEHAEKRLRQLCCLLE
ncbi:MAG: hypothetical protein BWY99_00560 [Synergistetes bacterium ADurb.BinA166]|jgi:hypothetical protein|nr:MAG: hypothetical protein BWY99_00560 [Synergistetes bacterium ADurb.BinA166]